MYFLILYNDMVLPNAELDPLSRSVVVSRVIGTDLNPVQFSLRIDVPPEHVEIQIFEEALQRDENSRTLT